jgi:hypothetical protein
MNFEPDTVSEEFSRLIGKVFSSCENFEPESKEEEEYNEKYFKKSIKEIFYNMQKYFDE